MAVSGSNALPRPPTLFENLDWFSNHINHKQGAISNLPTKEVSNSEGSAEEEDLESQVLEAESPDSGSVSERLHKKH